MYEADFVKLSNMSNENWIVLQIDRDLARYYQYWLSKHGVQLAPSSWKPHISVVRGEKMDRRVFSDWMKANGNQITFEYHDEPKRNDRGFIWLDCWSKELNDLRQTLGLYLKRNDRFHFTVAKMKEGISYYGIDKLIKYDP